MIKCEDEKKGEPWGQEEFLENKQEILELIEVNLVEYLIENENVLSLAQVKQVLGKKMATNVDLAEMGYSKLKSLIDDISGRFNLVNIDGTNS